MSAFKPVKTDDTDSFFRAFKADAKIEVDRYDVVAFGDSEKMADELLELVLAGIKRATASLARDFGDAAILYPLSATLSSWLTGATSRAVSGGRPTSK